jgi:hypothetical protein
MRESVVETYFRKRVTAAGAEVRKYVSPGRRGVADRLVFWPRARLHLVELKAPGKTEKPHQVRERKRMTDLGFFCIVLDSKEAVDEYIDLWSK